MAVVSERPVSADDSFQLNYSVDDFPKAPRIDSKFVRQRVNEELVREGLTSNGRMLDVACGTGQLGVEAHRQGVESWGLDPSPEMLGLSRWLYPADRTVLVRGIGESLPIQGESFDCVVCNSALDHFVDPHDFMREAARIVRVGGRVVVVLANYESFSCLLSRSYYRLARDVLRRPIPPDRPHWTPPPDHLHKGDLRFVRSLGVDGLRLERCRGVSLMWLCYGWSNLLERMPARLATSVLSALDRVATRVPSRADIIIARWQKVAPSEP